MTTKLMNTSAIVYFTIALFIFSVSAGCKKSENLRPASTGNLLDSIVTGSSSLHFIYDEQERVIEERFQTGDSLQERSTYEYIGSSFLPFKRNRYYRDNATPEYSAEFQYNSDGQKIYDSAYFLSAALAGNYVTASLNYSAAGHIIVLQKAYGNDYLLQIRLDTLNINTAGKIDSLESYSNVSQPPSLNNMYYYYSIVFNQFDAAPNVLRSLSTSACNFYAVSAYNFGNCINSYSSLMLDYYNASYPAKFSQRSFADNSVYVFQSQYNSLSLPVSQNVTGTYQANNYFNSQYRFVYR